MSQAKLLVARFARSTKAWLKDRVSVAEKKLVHICEYHPVAVGAIALVATTCILFVLDIVYAPSPKEILVEAHGLLFDVLLFGVIILSVDLWRAKRERVIRY